jgi:hypothetical protein
MLIPIEEADNVEQPINIEQPINYNVCELDHGIFDRVRNGELTLIDQIHRAGYDQKMQFNIYDSQHNHITIIEFLIDDEGYVYADHYGYMIRYTNRSIDIKTAIMKIFNTDEPRVVINTDNGLPIENINLYNGYVVNRVPIRQYDLIQGDIYIN